MFVKTLFYPRFSLLSLLLLVTLAAVSVSHWLTSRQLILLRPQYDQQRQKILLLNDQLGFLTIDDASKVHVISIGDALEAIRQKGDPRRFDWRLFLPPKSAWHVCWAVGEVPTTGVPQKCDGSRRLQSYAADETSLTVSLHENSDESAYLWFHQGPSDWTVPIPPHKAAQLALERPLPWDLAGGDVTRRAHTQVFPPNQPVVLLRRMRVWTAKERLYAPNASNQELAPQGILIWLEARADD